MSRLLIKQLINLVSPFRIFFLLMLANKDIITEDDVRGGAEKLSIRHTS